MPSAYAIEHASRYCAQGFSFSADAIPMSLAASAPVEDRSEARSRAQSIEIGALVILAAAAAAFAYAVATWDSPHRGAIVAMLAGAPAWALAPLLFGAERIVRSRHREAFFIAWSSGTIALIVGLVAADGGSRSPLALLFFLPLAYAALSYPLPSVVVIGIADVLAFAASGMIAGHAPQAHVAFFAAALAITALLCGWEAIDHDRQRSALARVSRADPLTGCLNRRGFEERLEAEIDGATRHNGSLALVVLDLDHFKAVNDTHGHEAGDDLLRWTVERAGETLRPMDSIGRLGGDEFAVLVPGAGPEAAREVADRLRDAFLERVQVSAGVATFPADGVDRNSLHRHADADLYASKHGRGGARDLSFASALASAVNLRMAVPDEHLSAVPHYALAIGERLGLPPAEAAMLRLAAILHDVGKVSVPDRILRKPGPLTVDEFEHVKGHPAAGAEIVAHIDGLSPVSEWIRHSHENVDGSGYPDRLRGDDIPLPSRILLVADAFDAMTSTRPYGSPFPPDMALAELHRGAGTQFDARCVAALAEHVADNPADLRVRRFVRPAASAA
jgi:diguanylate cyclase (GGDEF)-like protein